MGFKLQMSWLPSLLSQKRKNSPPLGLRNLGNTCYLNSVLQCLTYTPPLANFCLNYQHSSLCDTVLDGERKRDCPFCILEKRIARSLSVDLSIDAPNKILSCLKIYAEHFKLGRQEDAHEFLRYVIDACHNACLRLKKLRRKGTEPFNGNSVVKEIFGGTLQSQVKCLSCGAESNKVDEIMDISLDILYSSSLRESLRKFFQPEILDGNNKYRCENCKKLVAARKQMSFLQAPNILVIPLKRFEGVFGAKIDKSIAFEEVLVLSSFMCKASKDPQPEYSLFGTIIHSGISPESGHYYAYIKDAMGRWYCCNDSLVSFSTLHEVLSEKAYILFFCRTSQRPGFSRTPVVSNGAKNHENASDSSKAKKSVAPLKHVDIKSNIEQSVHKSSSATPKVERVPLGPLAKANFSMNIGAKKASSAANGKIALQRDQSTVANGVLTDKIHLEKGEKDALPSMTRGTSYIKKKVGAVKEGKQAKQNDTAHHNGDHLAKPDNHESNGKSNNGDHLANADTHESNGKSNGVEAERLSNQHELADGSIDSRSSAPDSKKRSFQNSCILLHKDEQSLKMIQVMKEFLEKDTESHLRSCGWYDKVQHAFINSKKRFCTEEAEEVHRGSSLKKRLIADVKPTFISQIPESLKAKLVERIVAFNQDGGFSGS